MLTENELERAPREEECREHVEQELIDGERTLCLIRILKGVYEEVPGDLARGESARFGFTA